MTGRITNASVVQLMCPRLKFNGLIASDLGNAKYLQLTPYVAGLIVRREFIGQTKRTNYGMNGIVIFR